MAESVAGHRAITIPTPVGRVHGLLHEPLCDGQQLPIRGAAVLVAGAGGGVTGPSGIYEGLAEKLKDHGIVTLRLDYRRPAATDECIYDLRKGLDYLQSIYAKSTSRDVDGANAPAGPRGGSAGQLPMVSSAAASASLRAVVIGWSFGGAVVLRAASEFPDVVGAATVASQTAAVGDVDVAGAQGKSLLFLHGTADRCLSCQCSQALYKWSKEPKELCLLEGDDHGLTKNHKAMEHRLVEFVTGVLDRSYVSPAGERQNA